MTDFYKLIPKEKRESVYNIEPLDFRKLRKTSPLWYLSYPTPVISLCGGHNSQLVPLWFCMAGPNRMEQKIGDRTYVIDHCGAPPGVRCSRCRTQEQDHDPGDEDG